MIEINYYFPYMNQYCYNIARCFNQTDDLLVR